MDIFNFGSLDSTFDAQQLSGGSSIPDSTSTLATVSAISPELLTTIAFILASVTISKSYFETLQLCVILAPYLVVILFCVSAWLLSIALLYLSVWIGSITYEIADGTLMHYFVVSDSIQLIRWSLIIGGLFMSLCPFVLVPPVRRVLVNLKSSKSIRSSRKKTLTTTKRYTYIAAFLGTILFHLFVAHSLVTVFAYAPNLQRSIVQSLSVGFCYLAVAMFYSFAFFFALMNGEAKLDALVKHQPADVGILTQLRAGLTYLRRSYKCDHPFFHTCPDCEKRNMLCSSIYLYIYLSLFGIVALGGLGALGYAMYLDLSILTSAGDDGGSNLVLTILLAITTLMMHVAASSFMFSQAFKIEKAVEVEASNESLDIERPTGSLSRVKKSKQFDSLSRMEKSSIHVSSTSRSKLRSRESSTLKEHRSNAALAKEHKASPSHSREHRAHSSSKKEGKSRKRKDGEKSTSRSRSPHTPYVHSQFAPSAANQPHPAVESTLQMKDSPRPKQEPTSVAEPHVLAASPLGPSGVEILAASSLGPSGVEMFSSDGANEFNTFDESDEDGGPVAVEIHTRIGNGAKRDGMESDAAAGHGLATRDNSGIASPVTNSSFSHLPNDGLQKTGTSLQYHSPSSAVQSKTSLTMERSNNNQGQQNDSPIDSGEPTGSTFSPDIHRVPTDIEQLNEYSVTKGSQSGTNNDNGAARTDIKTSDSGEFDLDLYRLPTDMKKHNLAPVDENTAGGVTDIVSAYSAEFSLDMFRLPTDVRLKSAAEPSLNPSEQSQHHTTASISEDAKEFLREIRPGEGKSPANDEPSSESAFVTGPPTSEFGTGNLPKPPSAQHAASSPAAARRRSRTSMVMEAKTNMSGLPASKEGTLIAPVSPNNMEGEELKRLLRWLERTKKIQIPKGFLSIISSNMDDVWVEFRDVFHSYGSAIMSHLTAFLVEKLRRELDVEEEEIAISTPDSFVPEIANLYGEHDGAGRFKKLFRELIGDNDNLGFRDTFTRVSDVMDLFQCIALMANKYG